MVFNDSFICLAVEGDAGMDSVLGAHFRSSGYHFLYDTVVGDWEVVERPQYVRGYCSSSMDFVRPKVASVLTRGIGHRAYFEMLKQGVSVWVTNSETVREALHAWRSGLLLPLIECQLGEPMQPCEKWSFAREQKSLHESVG